MSALADELADEWTTVPLLEVADVIMGQSPPGHTYNTDGIGLPFFQGKAEFGEDHPTARKWCTSPTRIAEVGDLLMSVRAPVGPTNIADERCAIGRGLAVIRPKAGIPVGLLRHALALQEQEIASWGTGTTFTAINKEHFKRIAIELPPPTLRQPLSDLLDESIRKRRSSLLHLRTARRILERFRQAVLVAACSGQLTADWRANHRGHVDAVDDLLRELRSGSGKEVDNSRSGDLVFELPESWRIARGHEAFTFVTSGSRGWAKYYSEDGPKFLRVGNLDRHRLDLDLKAVQSVSPPATAEATRTRVQARDLLISITAEVGMVGVVPPDLGEGYVNQHVAIARPHHLLSPRYLAAFIAAPSFGEAQLDALQRGATKAGLGLDDIRSMLIPLPPGEEQAEIARRLDSLLSLADRLDKRIHACSARIDRIASAFAAKAFRGGLDHSGSSS